MAKVQLDLNVNTQGSPQVEALVKQLVALGTAGKNVNATPPAAPPALDSWERLTKLLSGGSDSARKLKQDLSGVTGTLQNVAEKTVSATGFAGPLAGLVGVTSIAAVLGVVGAIVGQSLKMAYEFERSSVRAAAALSIGFGGSLASNTKRVEAAAYSGEKYGYNVQEMVQAMEVYGRTSGANAAQATAAAPGIAQYSRAFGLDPAHTAALVGSFQAASGDRGDFASSANDVFGGAEQAGPLGRRIDEFAATATSVLTSLEYGQSGSRIDPARATGFTSMVAREGGIYATSGGVQATLQAGEDLVGGGTSDIQKAAFLQRAGLSERDIVLGNVGQDGGNIRKVLQEVQKEYGDLHGNLATRALTAYVGPSEARLIEGLKDPLKDFGMPKTAAETAREAKQKADDFAATPEGMVAHAMATLSNTMTADGVKLLDLGKKILDETDALGKLTVAIDTLDADITAFTKWWMHPAHEGAPGEAEHQNDLGPAWKGDYDPSYNREQNQAYHSAVRKGVDPKVAAQWALAGANPDAEDAVIMTAITKNETGSQAGTNEMNLSGSGAAGIYQMMPSTAEQYAPADWIKKYGHIWGSDAAHDPSGKVQGPGFAAWFGSPKIQRVTALNYEHELAKEAWDKGYRGADFVKAVMQGYYSGDVVLSHNPSGGKYGGDEYESGNAYANQGYATYDKMENSDFKIEVKVTPKPKHPGHKKPTAPSTRPRASTKPLPHPAQGF